MTFDYEQREALSERFAVAPPLPDSVLREVIDRLSETPQQRASITGPTTGRFQTMFSATKFVIAGAIVALFGGFLLAGVMTQPSDEQLPAVGASASAPAEPTAAVTTEPEPTAEVETDATNLLPGVDLVTEEVEPGVHRVLDDGAGHDLAADPPRALTLASDGDLVLFYEPLRDTPFGPLDRFYVLGQEGEQALDGLGDLYWFDAAIDDAGDLVARLTPDGSDDGRLAYFDGTSWTELTWPNGSAKVGAVEVGADGSLWVARSATGRGPRVARIEDGVLAVLPVPEEGARGRYLAGADNFKVAPDGTIWFASNDLGTGRPLPEGTKRLLHFDGERWLVPDVPIDPGIGQFGPLAIGPDGTLWVYATDGAFTDVPPYLLRLRDGAWSVFTEADGVPHLRGNQVFAARLAVDGEGTLWIAFDGDTMRVPSLPPPLGPSDPPHGVLSFDGSTWRQYLKGHWVNRVGVADDGAVWATSRADCTEMPGRECLQASRSDGLYVITPEAVAVAE